MKTIEATTSGELTFVVRIVPRASRSEVVGWTSDGALKVRVTAAPVDNQANQELVRLLSKQLGVGRSGVVITSGSSSRSKRLQVPPSCENRLSSYPDI